MEIASIFDPLGNAVHTALSWDMVGEDVLITGAGVIGCMAAAVCKKAGAKTVVITDINDFRLSLAKTLGADRTVNVTREKLEDVMKELEMTEGFDVCLEMQRRPVLPERHHRQFPERSQHFPAGHPAGRLQHRMEQVYLEGAENEGHLRA